MEHGWALSDVLETRFWSMVSNISCLDLSYFRKGPHLLPNIYSCLEIDYFQFGRGDFHVLFGIPSSCPFVLCFLASWNKRMSLTSISSIVHNHWRLEMPRLSCMFSEHLTSLSVFVHLPFTPKHGQQENRERERKCPALPWSTHLNWARVPAGKQSSATSSDSSCLGSSKKLCCKEE